MARPVRKNPVTVRLDQHYLDEVGDLAQKQGLARCAFLRRVVEDYLSKQKNHAARTSSAA
ncbi:MAG: hypothetical protein PUP93_31930 [Rhizonema sp. NSF051]|nr:hypothetical protein [Rhizonema sp. NSF051]